MPLTQVKNIVANISSDDTAYTPAGTGAVATTVQEQLRFIQNVTTNVQDAPYYATGDGTTDDSDAIQAAITTACSHTDPATYGSSTPYLGPVEVFFPAGVYKITRAITATRSVSIRGDGHSEFSTGTRIVQFTNATDHFTINPIAQGASVSFKDLTLTASGGGGTSGACINVTKAAGVCNSIRIIGCTFGTPQAMSIKIQTADDVIIHDNLFDVSATGGIALGTATAADVVSNCSIQGNAFYSIASYCIATYNVSGLLINGNRVYPSGANTGTFMDGYNTLPYQIKNLVVSGNNFNGVNCIANLSAVNGFTIQGNNGTSLGAGAGATLSCLELTGTCSKINISGNVLSGSFDTKNIYNDTGATVTSCTISGNTFVATSGTGQALKCVNTSGSITENSMVGFSTESVGEQIYTTGSAIAVGVIAAGATALFNKTITGARQGDKVTITPISLAWPVPAGIVVTSYISATNTVELRYDNVTAGPIGVPPHDFGILVTR